MLEEFKKCPDWNMNGIVHISVQDLSRFHDTQLQNKILQAEAVDQEAWNQYLGKRRKDLANAVSKMKCILPGHSSENRLCDRCNALYPDYAVEPIEPEDNFGARVLAVARAAVKTMQDEEVAHIIAVSNGKSDSFTEYCSEALEPLIEPYSALPPSDKKMMGVE